jgi:hypothetical protein
MILTASDVSSLAKSLSRWEIAEYVFAGLVTVACAGEYVADFKDWFTGGDKAKKERLAKASTLLLIGALALELTCLVKTNSLSGQLIGSLDQKAGEADAKANTALGTSATALTRSADAIADSSTALSRAKDALAKAGKAAASLGKAEDEADKAQTASSSALTLAREARQEADSFEQDIVSAKKQAAEAESHLAEALRQTTAATEELNRLKTARSLSEEQQARIVSKIKPFHETPFDLWVTPDSDSTAIMELTDSMLRSAGWTFKSTEELIVYDSKAGLITASGVSVHVPTEHPEWRSAVIALRDALAAEGIPTTAFADTADAEKEAKRDRIHVMIGSKPLK